MRLISEKSLTARRYSKWDADTIERRVLPFMENGVAISADPTAHRHLIASCGQFAAFNRNRGRSSPLMDRILCQAMANPGIHANGFAFLLLEVGMGIGFDRPIRPPPGMDEAAASNPAIDLWLMVNPAWVKGFGPRIVMALSHCPKLVDRLYRPIEEAAWDMSLPNQRGFFELLEHHVALTKYTKRTA